MYNNDSKYFCNLPMLHLTISLNIGNQPHVYFVLHVPLYDRTQQMRLETPWLRLQTIYRIL